MAWSAANAVFEDGTLRPAGEKKHCEVWWHIKLPYLATYISFNVAVDCAGGDLFGVAISPDAGRSLHPIYWKAGPPPKVLTVKPGDVPSVRGMQEFWIRVDMSTQSAASPLRLRGFQITVGYQLNMHILPRLVPGKNELYLQADRQDNVKLQAEWAYTHPDGERVETLTLAPGEKTTCRSVDPKINRPEDIIMRGVTLRCLPAK
jgi:hypothetical protein